MTEQEIVDFLLENSPPGSGPVYVFLAEYWEIIFGGLMFVLVLTFFVSLVFAASIYLEISE